MIVVDGYTNLHAHAYGGIAQSSFCSKFKRLKFGIWYNLLVVYFRLPENEIDFHTNCGILLVYW